MSIKLEGQSPKFTPQEGKQKEYIETECDPEKYELFWGGIEFGGATTDELIIQLKEVDPVQDTMEKIRQEIYEAFSCNRS